MVADTWAGLTNLRRGVLEFCVLAALSKEPAYVYSLERRIFDRGVVLGIQSSLYPILGRLQRSRHVEAQWVESPSGPPRKYYSITKSGQTALSEFREVWPTFSSMVSKMVKEEHLE